MKEKFASSSLKDFVEVVELYRSGSGAVFKARFKYDNQLYVLKEKKLPELGKAKDIMNEVKLLEQLRHSNIVQCEGWFRDHERRTIVIVLEYCDGGDLDQLMTAMRRKRESFSELEVWTIFEQLCSGVKHLHSNGIIHRDIKPLNIFMDKDHRTFKIGDLGVSRQVSEQTVLVQTFYGTPLYLSPELIENRAYNEKTDVWSLGILLYELCTLQPPFKANSLMALARLILQGDYTPLAEDKYSSAMSRCIKWLLTKEFSKRPSIAMVEELVRKQRLALLQLTSSSISQANLNMIPAPPPVANVQRQLGLGLAADQSIAAGYIHHENANEDLDDDSLDGHHHKQHHVVALAHYNNEPPRERSGSADTRSTASHDDDHPVAQVQRRQLQDSNANHNDDASNNNNHRHHRRVQMAEDFPSFGGGDESSPPPQPQQQPQQQQKKRPSTAGPTNISSSHHRHVLPPAGDMLPLEIFPSAISKAQAQQQLQSLPATNQDHPRSSSHRQQQQQQEVKVKEREVPINMARAVAKLRREAIRYRKLLQMRDFFSFSTNHINNTHDNDNENNNKRNDSIANNKLKEAEMNIALLEYALDHHRLAESDAIRLDILMTEKAVEPSPPSVKERAVVIGNDNVPVYLQADPRRWNKAANPRQSSPTNKNRFETKHINLNTNLAAAGAVFPIRSNSFAAVTSPRSRRVAHAVDDSEIIALRPQEEAAAIAAGLQRGAEPRASQNRQQRSDHARAKPCQLFDINVHFDRQVLTADNPASPLQQLLANSNSNSKRRPVNNKPSVVAAAVLGGLELPSMSPKNKDSKNDNRKQQFLGDKPWPSSAAPISRQQGGDMIKSDKAMLYKHARHMSDIMAVLEKDPRYHSHEQGGVKAIIYGDRPMTAAVVDQRSRQARASRSRSRTRSRSPDNDERRVSPDPRQSAIARKQRAIMMGQVRPRTASAAAAAGAAAGGDSSKKKEKRRQDKGIMIRQQTSYNIITGDDHD